MDWFDGPLDTVFGIPAFWITRIVKILQFLAACVIILEIVGRDRLDAYLRKQATNWLDGPLASFSQRMREVLSNNVFQAPFRNAFLGFKYAMLGEVLRIPRYRQGVLQIGKSRYFRVLSLSVLGLAIVFMIVLCAHVEIEPFWLEPALGLLGLPLMFILSFIVVLPSLTVLAWLGLKVSEVLLFKLVAGLKHLLFEREFSRFILLLALIFYATAFVLDMAIS